MKNLIAATLAAAALLLPAVTTTGSPTPPNDGTARSQALTAYELGHHGDHHYPRHLRVVLSDGE